jgi:hypothetical protein
MREVLFEVDATAILEFCVCKLAFDLDNLPYDAKTSYYW